VRHFKSKSVFLTTLIICNCLLIAVTAWGIESRFLLDPATLDRRPARPEAAGDTTGKKAASTADGVLPAPRAAQTKPGSQKQVNGKPPARRTVKRTVTSKNAGKQFGRLRDDVTFMQTVRQFWPELIPAQTGKESGVEIDAKNYSLSLDPVRFPTLAAADGGKIIIDSGGEIPKLVKTLLLNEDGKTRIVSEKPANRKYFFRALLTAAQFYSVEENFRVEFGSDPLLQVTADYLIEKNPDSLLRHELTLLNTRDDFFLMPPSLVSFLGTEGFQVLEPFADQRHTPARRGDLVQILSKDYKEIADSVMRSLTIQYETDRRIDLYNFKESGIALQVRVDRFFEMAGDRFVVSYFEGDPVSYTLTRLLETKGYRVIILENRDGLPRITDKFLSKMRLPGKYARHELWPGNERPWSVQLSGVMLRQKMSGGELFLTDRELDPLTAELIDASGFRILKF